MKVLTTGMGWIEHQPGGLNRYFADYTNAMRALGHREKGLIVGPPGGRPNTALDIVNVMERTQAGDLLSRMKSVRRHSAEAVRAFRPDVFNPHFALYVTLVSRSLIPDHVPIVTHFHGPWALESKIEEKKGGKAGIETRFFLKKQVEKLAYRRSDSFIVLSEYFRDILAGHYGVDHRRIHIIPGAVDHERFAPHPDRSGLRLRLGIAPDTPLLFCARRLVKRMGIERLIEAMAEVVKRHPKALLRIAGDGPMRASYEERIAALGLSASVKLLGRISNEELVEWYQAADYSVVPTITLEGFGLVTVESLACGTPVLGTPYGGTKEILQRLSDDLLFRDGTPQAIAGRLIAVLDGRCGIPSREACRAHVLERYTWRRVAESVTDVFREEVEKRRKG